MVLYKEDPNLTELKVVTTFNGNKEYRKNCKYIKEKYYTINRDCYEIEGTWYRMESGNIVMDYEKKQYTLKKGGHPLIFGIVKDENGNLTKGYFSPNPYNNITISSGRFGQLPAMSLDILGEGWVENMKTHMWHDKSELTTNQIASLAKIANFENAATKGYNIEDNPADYEIKKQNYENYPTVITPKVKQLAKYLGDISFGFEFELAQGTIPNHLQHRLGIVPVRDGSLNGGMELVTIPMTGAKGLQTIVNIADELVPRGEISLDCSLHIHFGNIGTDKLTIVSLYKLCRAIQEELFTMFPYYKTSPDGIKQKNYTKKLQKLNIGALKDLSKDAYEAYLLDSWNKLFTFYGEKQVSVDTFNKVTREHPIQNKWNRPSRYFYFNFMNMFFTHRHTLEARLSGPTTNKDKIINWFLICNAIIKYSQKYAKEIITNDKTISLKEILEIYPVLYPTDKTAHLLSKYLYGYFQERQARFKKDLEKGDYKSLWDITEDKQYKYKYNDINLLD